MNDAESVRLMAPGAKRRVAMESKIGQPYRPIPPQPEWTTIDGHAVLMVPGANVAAVPATGRKNSRHFVAFNVSTRAELCQLLNSEVRGWLIRTSSPE